LTLIARNRKISDKEAELVSELCKVLNIENNYCKNAIERLYSNKFVLESPPKFLNQAAARAFVRDAIKIGFADKNLHLFALNWLKFVAEANNIDKTWCILQLQDYLETPEEDENIFNMLSVNQLVNIEDEG